MEKLTPVILLIIAAPFSRVHTRRFPYIIHTGAVQSNHSYIHLGEVAEDNVECQTDLHTCCSMFQGPDRADWFTPSGEKVGFADSGTSGVFEVRDAQRVELRRAFGEGAVSGLYRCDIGTTAVHRSGGMETVYVGLYTTGGDITIPSGMTFTEVSDINGAGPQFILTCISAGGPATTVTWARDSGVLSQSKTLTIATVLDDPVTARYTHTLAVTGRQDGNYSCAVSNSKPSLARAALYVGAPPPPSGLKVSQNGLDSALVSWAPPSVGGAAVTGYTIYYQQHGGQTLSVSAGAAASSATITGLITGSTYSISIVASSKTWPSSVSIGEVFTLRQDYSSSVIPTADKHKIFSTSIFLQGIFVMFCFCACSYKVCYVKCKRRLSKISR